MAAFCGKTREMNRYKTATSRRSRIASRPGRPTDNINTSHHQTRLIVAGVRRRCALERIALQARRI
jgi:hypothetical protein